LFLNLSEDKVILTW